MTSLKYSKANLQVRTETDLPVHLNCDGFRQIYYSLVGKDQLLCGPMWETGGRISEILNLKWADIPLFALILQKIFKKLI